MSDESTATDRETFTNPDAGLRDLLVASLAGRYGAFDPAGDGDSPRGDWNTVVAEVVLPILRRLDDTQLAATREALADAIQEGHEMHAESGREGCWAHAARIADHVFSYVTDDGKPLLRDADEVRREEQMEAADSRAELRAAIERTRDQMQHYIDAREPGEAAMVNCRQVINLLSPTWPDGNYEAGDIAEEADE